MKRKSQILVLLTLFISGYHGIAQTYDLHHLLTKGGLELIDRKVEAVVDGQKKGISFTDNPESDGYAIIKGLDFKEGTIEVDIKGKDLPGQNFVGIAFHDDGNGNADIIYFRPFNFRSKEQIRRSHSVQYVSVPAHDWSTLREAFPGKYENEIASPPDPNGWFHAKIVVKGKEVTVYVDNATEPCLKVTKLNERNSGKLGLWVGFKTSGEFANLVVTQTK